MNILLTGVPGIGKTTVVEKLVGPYAVFLDGLDTVGVDAIRAGIATGSVILIDEIGKMEAKSSAFRTAVTEALESGCHTVATLGISGEPFLREVRGRRDARLVEVTRANRDRLPEAVFAALRSGHWRGDTLD
jgi:nucleoside-triphosphatase